MHTPTTPPTPTTYGLVFANGDYIDGEAVRAALRVPPGSRCVVIAADGGLRHALALSLSPDVVIGDMDSADPLHLAMAEGKGATLERFPAAKDEIDLELALRAAASRGCDVIRIFAAIGDRFDQTISNVYLLALPALAGRDATLVSGRQTLRLLFPGDHTIDGHPGDTLSLVPVAGDAAGIVTEALEYPLRGETLRFGSARGVSNVMLAAQARITFERGVLLVVHTIGRA